MRFDARKTQRQEGQERQKSGRSRQCKVVAGSAQQSDDCDLLSRPKVVNCGGRGKKKAWVGVVGKVVVVCGAGEIGVAGRSIKRERVGGGQGHSDECARSACQRLLRASGHVSRTGLTWDELVIKPVA
jgi:hypothetical protein